MLHAASPTAVPTKHRRLSIALDPELGNAPARARRVEGREVADATLVRDLVLRGEAILMTDLARRRRLLEELADPFSYQSQTSRSEKLYRRRFATSGFSGRRSWQ